MITKRILRRGALIAAALVVAAAFGAELYLLDQQGDAAWNNAVRASESLASTLADSVDETFADVDHALTAAQAAAELAGFSALPSALQDTLLFGAAPIIKGLETMMVVSPEGRALYRFPAGPAEDRTLASEAFFKAQLSGKGFAYLGGPQPGLLRPDAAALFFSRRLSRPDGQFDGVVVATVKLDALRSKLAPVNVGRNGIVILVRNDGRVLLRQPSTDGQGNAGRDLSAARPFRRMSNDPTISFTEVSSTDGVNRFYVNRQLTHAPVILTVAFAVDDVMKDWHRQALMLMVGGASLCLIILALIVAFFRALESRFRIEEELEGLVYTDKLTGLPNRRHFEEMLHREWRKAARSDEPLSVLMVEMERFGEITSRLGHAAADSFLKEVADRLSATLKRPADSVARYGADEFAVLLPDTNRNGAARIAERLKQAIESVPAIGRDGERISAVARIGCVTTIVAPGADVAEIQKATERARAMARNSRRQPIASEEYFSRKPAR